MATAKKRQPYGAGSVYKRASDGRWIGKIQVGWSAKGTRRTVTVSAKTEAECRRRLRDRQREILTEGVPEEGLTNPTVKAWAEQWLTMHARDVRPKAFATDQGAVKRWIIPAIGHRRLDHLRPGDVRALREAVTRPDPPRFPEGRSLTTARQAHWTLMGMLKAARQEGHRVPLNVTAVKAPARVKSDREAIAFADAVSILGLVLDRPDGARWVAALVQGLRQGEALGLTWDAVDLADHELDVSWQLQSLPYLDPKNKASGFRVPDGYEARHLTHAYHLVRPKTTSGQRIIPLAPWMAESLQLWRQIAPANPWGLIWCGVDARNGRMRPTPMRGVVDREMWEGLQDAAGVRHPAGRHYTLHEARNTAATLLFEADVDPKTITQILGHSSIITSRGYQTVSRAEARRALEKVAERLQLGMAPEV